MNNKPRKKETFESSLEELEAIVRRLEAGEQSLEESLELFEKGVGFAKSLSKQLEEAKQKVEVLVKDGAGYARKPLKNED